MTSKQQRLYLAMLAGAIPLAGCLVPGTGDNKIDSSGVVIHIGESHLEGRLTTARSGVGVRDITGMAHTLGGNASALTDYAYARGYDRPNIEHHDVVDGATPSHLLSIYRAYIVIDEVRIVKCASVSQLPGILFDSVFPKAMAHAGHGSEPVGGRSLDKPNVIDIVTQDQFVLALGDRSVAPGRYCSMRVSFARAAGNSYGKPTPAPASADNPTTVPDIPDMQGKMLAMRADYCSEVVGGSCVTRTKVDIDDTGLTLPEAVEVQFDKPFEVNEKTTEGYVVIGIAYGEWVENVNVAILNSDANERQKLLNNVAKSIHGFATGNGGLPINTQ